MQTTHYKLNQFVILCRGIGAAASMLALFANVQTMKAADGDLDPTFGVGGKVMTDFNHSTDWANAVAIQPDGKFVVVGTTYKQNDFSDEDFAVARYNTDGTLDSSFGSGGKVHTDFLGLAAVPSSVLLQPDAKILVVGGAYPLFTFLGNIEMVRYNSNGNLDRSFGDNGIVTTVLDAGSYANAVVQQSDGKIIVAGTLFVDVVIGDQSDTDFVLVRYNRNGSLDTTFGNGGVVSTDFFGKEDDAFSVLLQPDGKIVAVGSANDPASYYDFAAVRYLNNGTIDETFGNSGTVTTDFGDQNFDRARSAVLLPNGKIIAAGFAISQGGGVQNFAVARYTKDGVLDNGFSNDGKQQITFDNCCQSANQVLLQPDGKIITVGYANTEDSDSDFLLARLNPNGSLDSTFGVAGKVRTSFGDLNGGANGAALQQDGKIVAVGFQATFSNHWSEFALARYLDGQ